MTAGEFGPWDDEWEREQNTMRGQWEQLFVDGPVWTLLMIGPRRRAWGFWTPDMPWTPWAQFDPDAGTRP